MKKNKIACVVYYTDDRYDGLVSNVKNSFLKFNGEECDYYQIDYTNQEEYNKSLEHFEYAPETFLMQYIYAYEIMKKYNLMMLKPGLNYHLKIHLIFHIQLCLILKLLLFHNYVYA